jgi:cohesin loading factor subunit SCC2
VAPPKSLVTACKQIVDCLIENVLRLEETCFAGMLDTSGSSGQSDNSDEPRNSSQRLVACLTTLYLLAKIRPQLLVDHATTLQPYLSLKCKVKIRLLYFELFTN